MSILVGTSPEHNTRLLQTSDASATLFHLDGGNPKAPFVIVHKPMEELNHREVEEAARLCGDGKVMFTPIRNIRLGKNPGTYFTVHPRHIRYISFET